MIDHSMTTSVSFTTSVSADNRRRTLLDQTRQRLAAKKKIELDIPPYITDLTSNSSHAVAGGGIYWLSPEYLPRKVPVECLIQFHVEIFLLEGITFFRYAFKLIPRPSAAYDQSFGAEYVPFVPDVIFSATIWQLSS